MPQIFMEKLNPPAHLKSIKIKEKDKTLIYNLYCHKKLTRTSYQSDHFLFSRKRKHNRRLKPEKRNTDFRYDNLIIFNVVNKWLIGRVPISGAGHELRLSMRCLPHFGFCN